MAKRRPKSKSGGFLASKNGVDKRYGAGTSKRIGTKKPNTASRFASNKKRRLELNFEDYAHFGYQKPAGFKPSVKCAYPDCPRCIGGDHKPNHFCKRCGEPLCDDLDSAGKTCFYYYHTEGRNDNDSDDGEGDEEQGEDGDSTSE